MPTIWDEPYEPGETAKATETKSDGAEAVEAPAVDESIETSAASEAKSSFRRFFLPIAGVLLIIGVVAAGLELRRFGAGQTDEPIEEPLPPASVSQPQSAEPSSSPDSSDVIEWDDSPAPEVDVDAQAVPSGSGSVHTKPDAEDVQVPEDFHGAVGQGANGAVAYSDELTYDLSTGTLSLVFQNPSMSSVDMVLSVKAEGREIYRSGLLPIGYGLSTVSCADPGLDAGVYPCIMTVEHYDPQTGAKSMVQLALNAKLTVSLDGGAVYH